MSPVLSSLISVPFYSLGHCAGIGSCFCTSITKTRRMVLPVSLCPLIIRTASSSDQRKCFVNWNNEIITSLTRGLVHDYGETWCEWRRRERSTEGNKRQESGGFIAAPATTSFIGLLCRGTSGQMLLLESRFGLLLCLHDCRQQLKQTHCLRLE